MKKAGGILITRNDDYKYIDTFIGFLERIINIILAAFERLSALTGDKKTSTDAEGDD